MLLANITSYLDKKFNQKKACEWDNVGFQNFYKIDLMQNFVVNKTLVCLDLNQKCLDYAIENHVNLIITRHPFIFEELKIEKTNPAKNKMIKQLIKNNIIVYSIHTNYDASSNQNLIDLLNNKLQIKKYKKFGNSSESYLCNLKNEIRANNFIKDLSDLFNCESIRLNFNLEINNLIKEFYITPGAGASTMIENSLTDCIFITGEVKWNEWIYANDNNVFLIEIGHYMENYFIDDIKNKLLNKFNDIEVLTYDIKNQFITKKGE